ncbi:MAG: hypothetical protein PUB18_00695 [bacterium]|nr:hypothetical protein [bacterium]
MKNKSATGGNRDQLETISKKSMQSTPNPFPIEQETIVEENIVNHDITQSNLEKESVRQNSQKSSFSVWIIFGVFLALIIGLPYIDDFLLKIKSDREMKKINQSLEVTPTAKTVVEPSVSPIPDVTSDAYINCGTSEVFTRIAIDYTTTQPQCFKIHLGTEKNFIQYLPVDNNNWNILLGDKILYQGTNQSLIPIITITAKNQVEMLESNSITQIQKLYTYDSSGTLVLEETLTGE